MHHCLLKLNVSKIILLDFLVFILYNNYMKKQFNADKFFEEFTYDSVNGGLIRIKSSRFTKQRKRKNKSDIKTKKQIRFDGETYLEHRLVFYFHYKYFPDIIDHINQDYLDNRIENLRECTQTQNMYNRGKTKSNKSGIKGVFWCKHFKKWRVCLDQTTLGYHVNLDDAKEHIKRAREEKHKDYTNHG